jgi:hypothetical protein
VFVNTASTTGAWCIKTTNRRCHITTGPIRFYKSEPIVRSLTSEEPVHILLVGPPGQAKTLFLKYILETTGEKKTFFTVGGNASKSGLIDVLFDLQPKYLLIDEIEHLKPNGFPKMER